MLYSIENEFYKIQISSYGAAFDSVYDKKIGAELLWQGDKASWEDKDITIFPIAGRLKDGFYNANGERYEMKIHGVAYYSQFECIEQTADKVVFELKSNPQTLKQYPYDFKLQVIYRIEKNKVFKEYIVENPANIELPYGVGFHPGFIIDQSVCEGKADTCENNIVFKMPQQVKLLEMDESGVFVSGVREGGYMTGLNLAKSVFSSDAVIFKDFNGGITLERKNGIKIEFELNSPPYLAFWTDAKSGNYICVEPWWSLPDYAKPNREFLKKTGINILEPKGKKQYSFSFTVRK